MRFEVALLAALAVALVGCSGKKKAKDSDKDKAPTQLEQMSGNPINVAAGTGTHSDAKSNPLWDVSWEEMAVIPGKDEKASMRRVHGHLYTDGKATVTFEADGARADRKQDLLILQGNVKVVSDKPEATLTCERMRYEAANPKRRIVKAQGNVRVVGSVGDMGPTSEIWASPDLNIVATPGMFDQR